jgi:hypothetical protein
MYEPGPQTGWQRETKKQITRKDNARTGAEDKPLLCIAKQPLEKHHCRACTVPCTGIRPRSVLRVRLPCASSLANSRRASIAAASRSSDAARISRGRTASYSCPQTRSCSALGPGSVSTSSDKAHGEDERDGVCGLGKDLCGQRMLGAA